MENRTSRKRSPMMRVRRTRSRSRSQEKKGSEHRKSHYESTEEKNRRRRYSRVRNSSEESDIESSKRYRKNRSRSRSRLRGTKSSPHDRHQRKSDRSHLRRASMDRVRSKSKSRTSSNSPRRNLKYSQAIPKENCNKVVKKSLDSLDDRVIEKSVDAKNKKECGEGRESEEMEMLKTMGFCDFASTSGKPVEGNIVGSVSQQVTRRKYRQYMNRRGGFNRPLDLVH